MAPAPSRPSSHRRLLGLLASAVLILVLPREAWALRMSKPDPPPAPLQRLEPLPEPVERKAPNPFAARRVVGPRSGSVSFDGLGTVSNLTDDSGTAQASYHLDAWGNYRFPAELDSSPNRFGFTGHYWDTETSLYYAKARYFDPEYGRFTTQDSVLGQLDSPPSLHRYFYANDNPTRYVDPSGHSAVDEWWAGATTFAKEFGTGVFELGANSLSFGGYSGVKRAYQSGDIDLSHPAQAAFRAWQHNAAAVLNKASFGFVEGAVDARSQGKGALGTIGGGTVGVADNFAPISETQTWNDSKASGWDKAEALATGTVKLAGTLIGAKGLLSKGSAITGTIAESRTALVPTRAAAAADSEALVSIERSATSAMPNTRHLAQVADVDELDALLVRLSERSVRHGAAARTAGMSGVKAGNLAETYLERYAAMVNERLSRYSSPFVVESQPAMLEGYGRVPSLIQYPGGQTRPFPDSLRLDLGLSDTRQMVGTPAVSEDLFPTLLRGYDITLNSAKVDAAVKYEPFGVKIRDIRPKAQ